MENTKRPKAETPQQIAYWQAVHSHTRYVYEAVEDRNIYPQDHASQVAYEALGIVHAMAHIALETARPLAVGLCPIGIAEGHLVVAAGTVDTTTEPER